MEKEYSRRKQQRPSSSSKSSIVLVILLLLINTLALGMLLFLNFQANSKQEERLSTIEKHVSQIDKAQGTNTQPSSVAKTEHNVPVKENSTQVSTAQEPESITENSVQPNQTTPSSQAVEQQTEPSAEPVVTPAATTYTVQSGDTLSGIAEKNKLSLQELMTKNNLTDSTVYIGQVLSLK
ncbi:LysM peptidoglycan-binding domain-containing protein [Candidatus Enterococcus mansonii]|uniref:LysM domain-containing protein n=1 Tax=Candidatus Enterococcus mansonii TaxID=1834181 RepID=A0A242CD06_9ENTE|nr:LysM peptidoglycan-binding domain-containing protein [Enterococcus sp. 4G2_DIV0659]OTO08127.1 hypothetical protein A5880_002397 [Enterococcus sp. 4G2_DIV0659]